MQLREYELSMCCMEIRRQTDRQTSSQTNRHADRQTFIPLRVKTRTTHYLLDSIVVWRLLWCEDLYENSISNRKTNLLTTCQFSYLLYFRFKLSYVKHFLSMIYISAVYFQLHFLFKTQFVLYYNWYMALKKGCRSPENH